MSNNGPPPNKLERIKTRLQQAGLSLEEIEKTFQTAKEAVRVLGMSLEQVAEATSLATSPPPPKKKTVTKPSKQESTDKTSDFVLGVIVGDLLDETP
jgi:DNA-binding transcriptional MerR regulator